MYKTKIFIFFIVAVFFGKEGLAQYTSRNPEDLKIAASETVSVLLSGNKAIDASIKYVIENEWKVCKYEFLTLDDLVNGKKLSKYYLTVKNYNGTISGINSNKIDVSNNLHNFSTNSSALVFGKRRNDLSKQIEKYKKWKNVEDIYCCLGSQIVSAFVDPAMIENDFSNISYSILTTNETSGAKDVLNESSLSATVLIHIRTIHWMLSNDMLSYYENPKDFGDEFVASSTYNKNSCSLKDLTLLVPQYYTQSGKSYDATKKRFNLSEFKQSYKFKTELVSDEKLREYAKGDSKVNYALLLEGIKDRAVVVFAVRLSDGAILFGSEVENISTPGFSKPVYKRFEKICK